MGRLSRSAHNLEHPLRYFFHALRSVHVKQTAQPPVIRHQRCGLLFVRLQPRPDNFFPIVRPLFQLAAIAIATSFHLRRALVNIVNLASHLAHAPTGDAPQHQRRVKREVHDGRACVAREDARAALSGGLAQRLMVARAILHEPAILFLDEPTAGLDPQSRLALWEILGELHREGQTIMLSTHHMEEADQLCDRVAIMDHGRILALDAPSGLKQSLGADTEVVVTAEGPPDRLAAHLQVRLGALRPGSDVRQVEDKVRVALKGVEGA